MVRGLEGACEVSYASTDARWGVMVAGCRFYVLRDFSRWDAWRIFPVFFQALRIVWQARPDVVITTGGAPGVLMVVAARVLLRRAVWIDSIASVSGLSLSGKLASRFANRCYTQWPELAGGRVKYAGNVIGSEK